MGIDVTIGITLYVLIALFLVAMFVNPAPVCRLGAWFWKRLRGQCYPYCRLDLAKREPNPGGLFFPMRYRCGRCKRVFTL